VNWFVERAQGQGRKARPRCCRRRAFSAGRSANVGGRAAIFADGRLFFVMGGKFCEYDVNGTETIRGTVAQDGNPAQIFYNGPVGGQLLIASGSHAYCFVLATNTFSQVLTGKATMIATARATFSPSSSRRARSICRISNDGTTWSLTTFFQRSLFADRWQGDVRRRQQPRLAAGHGQLRGVVAQ
jgi:hypothetical protein